MTPEVTLAVEEIRQIFGGHNVDVQEENQGGAYVTVNGITIGPRFSPSTSWIGFLVTFQYPRADVYPHYLHGTLQVTRAGNFPPHTPTRPLYPTTPPPPISPPTHPT